MQNAKPVKLVNGNLVEIDGQIFRANFVVINWETPVSGRFYGTCDRSEFYTPVIEKCIGGQL